MSIAEKLFKLKEAGSDVRTETVAGITTFLTMAYIIFVNPAILGDAGVPKKRCSWPPAWRRRWAPPSWRCTRTTRSVWRPAWA